MTGIQWTEETWRQVPDWPCMASNNGRVKGPSGKVLKPYRVTRFGRTYQHVLIRGRKLRIHHAVLLAFHGPRPEGHEGRHLDDDSANNQTSNLAWGTRRQNIEDQARNGRRRTGEDKPGARLTVAQVHQIRRDTRASRTVAADYGVSHTAVQRIRRGDRWAAA